MKKLILITGVAGFIGSNLADRLLADGYDVRGIDNLAYGVRQQVPTGVDFRQIDIRDESLGDHFAGVDTVFHLAAKNSISDCQLNPVDTADINIRGTVNVFEAVRKRNVRKIVHAESSAMYEGSVIFPTPESDVAPRSMYAVSKYAGMQFAQAYERFYELNVTALRYLCVYGPRQDYRRTIPPLMSAFILKLLRGEAPVIFGDGTKRRDFIYVDDVNDFHIRCISDARTNGKTFNLGGGANYSVLEIYDIISDLLNVHIAPTFEPDQAGEAFQNLGDISAARSIGWEPQVDIREGIQLSIEYIREHFMPSIGG